MHEKGIHSAVDAMDWWVQISHPSAVGDPTQDLTSHVVVTVREGRSIIIRSSIFRVFMLLFIFPQLNLVPGFR